MVQDILTEWLLEVRQLDAARGAQEVRAHDAAVLAGFQARQDGQPEAVQQNAASAAFQGSLAAEPALITQADYDALAATPLTAQDLLGLADARGKYRLTDTRSYVLGQEQLCRQCNCWMIRDVSGVEGYVSEAPT